MQLLVFDVAGIRYGLELQRVREVARAVSIAPLPDAPPVIEGLIDVRGTVIPVYDLRIRFGHPPRALHPDDKLVISWTGERLVALRCDRAEGIQAVDPARVDAAEPLSERGRWVAGVARLPDGLVLIHDPATFLSEAETETLDSALAGSFRSQRD